MDQVFMRAAKKILLHIVKVIFRYLRKKVAYDLSEIEGEINKDIQQEVGYIYHDYMGKLYELL